MTLPLTCSLAKNGAGLNESQRSCCWTVCHGETRKRMLQGRTLHYTVRKFFPPVLPLVPEPMRDWDIYVLSAVCPIFFLSPLKSSRPSRARNYNISTDQLLWNFQVLEEIVFMSIRRNRRFFNFLNDPHVMVCSLEGLIIFFVSFLSSIFQSVQRIEWEPRKLPEKCRYFLFYFLRLRDFIETLWKY